MSLDEETRKSIEDFKKKMLEKSKQVHTSLGKAITTACINVENSAKLGMTQTRVDPFKSYTRWKGKKVHLASAEGEYPAVDSGRLRQSITHSVEIEDSETVGRVGVNLPYGKYLEFGTSKMAARPWLAPSLEKNRAKIKQLLGNALKGGEVE